MPGSGAISHKVLILNIDMIPKEYFLGQRLLRDVVGATLEGGGWVSFASHDNGSHRQKCLQSSHAGCVGLRDRLTSRKLAAWLRLASCRLFLMLLLAVPGRLKRAGNLSISCRVGDGFATVAQAALRDASGSTPCLRIVSPAVAAKHRDTLLALGVRASLCCFPASAAVLMCIH